MPIKYVKNCKTCKFIKQEARRNRPARGYLVERIYKSKAWTATGEPLTALVAEYPVASYLAFRRHCLTHQAPTEDQLTKAKMDAVIKNKEKQIVTDIIKTESVRQTVMNKGLGQIESGEIKLRAADVLKAAKDQDDKELKQKDQGLKMMAMIQAFQSGEIKRDGYIEGEIVE